MHPQHWIYTAMRSKNWIKQHRKNWEICSWKVEVEKSPVDNRSTKPEKLEILSCQKIKKNMKKARKYGPFSLSSRPDSNRRPTHYECVALPAEPRKPVSQDKKYSTIRSWICQLFFWKNITTPSTMKSRFYRMFSNVIRNRNTYRMAFITLSASGAAGK